MDTSTLPRSRPLKSTFKTAKLLFFPGLSLGEAGLTRTEVWDLIKVAFGAFTLFSLLFALLTFVNQQRSVTREYDWRHKKEAQDILKDWDKQTSTQKAGVESYFRKRHGWSQMQPISNEDGRALRDAFEPGANATVAEKELWEARGEVVALLNYFETISTAILREIADEDILRDSLGDPMIAWRSYLRNYTDLMDARESRLVWKPYYEIVDKWGGKVNTGETSRPSHGWKSLEGR